MLSLTEGERERVGIFEEENKTLVNYIKRTELREEENTFFFNF